MNTTCHHFGQECNLRRLQYLAAVLVCCLASVGQAAPPRDPLPTPLYTFDAESPQVQAGTVGSNDVLALEAGQASVYIPGEDLDLGLDEDVIDALSLNRLIGAGETFVVLFSVDRATVGAVPPDEELVAADVPFNVQNQADRGQAAGDQYLSTTLFTQGSRHGARGGRGSNCTLAVAQYNEGGTEFGAATFISSSQQARRVEQDNVNSTATLPESWPPPPDPPPALYFSTTVLSPSLGDISTCSELSGATLLYNEAPGTNETTTYACYDQLGLVAQDEIDGLIVMDMAGNGVFEPNDQVVFSLASGSPSRGAAEVFIVQFGGQPTVLAPASALGLGHVDDNIDALELLLCDDAMACAVAHGIRGHVIPTVSEWGLVLTALLLLAAGAILIIRRRPAVARATR